MDNKLIKEYPVNPNAESLLNACLNIMLAFGWILALAGLGISIFYAVEMEQYYFIAIGVFGAAFILFCFYCMWATYKLFINMSRNLFNINERLKYRDIFSEV